MAAALCCTYRSLYSISHKCGCTGVWNLPWRQDFTLVNKSHSLAQPKPGIKVGNSTCRGVDMYLHIPAEHDFREASYSWPWKPPSNALRIWRHKNQKSDHSFAVCHQPSDTNLRSSVFAQLTMKKKGKGSMPKEHPGHCQLLCLCSAQLFKGVRVFWAAFSVALAGVRFSYFAPELKNKNNLLIPIQWYSCIIILDLAGRQRVHAWMWEIKAAHIVVFDRNKKEKSAFFKPWSCEARCLRF